MVRNIVHDRLFLSIKSKDATSDDIKIADDLMDTIKANSMKCVGMAANMIGYDKKIIVFDCMGIYREMFNPVITDKEEPFETEEGCLSLTGERKVTRYKKITVEWQDRNFKNHTGAFTGWTAQIIQHEVDHCNGILI